MQRIAVRVWLKPEIGDPVGEDLTKKAHEHKLEIEGIRTGKIFHMEIDASTYEAAEMVARSAAEKLLANGVIEEFAIEPWPLQRAAPKKKRPRG